MWASTDGTTMTAYEEEYYTRNQTLNANVYITVGSEEDTTFKNAAYRFYKHLTERSYSDLTLKYEEIEGYDHNTVFKPSIKIHYLCSMEPMRNNYSTVPHNSR